MSYQVLLGIDDPGRAAEVAALVHEDPQFAVVDVAGDAEGVITALGAWDVDAVILHEDLGPLPVMDLAREIGTRSPHVGVVLLVREATPEILRAALQAGVRDVLGPPVTFEELQATLLRAIQWSAALRERIAGGSAPTTEGITVGGRMIAVAGAKGGVGATTLSVHLALQAVRSFRLVCLVDFDLQTGDVAGLLDLTHHRTVADLVELAGEIGPGVLENTLYVDPSGLRVLLAPEEGEFGEEIRADVARLIVGGIKSAHDAVVVDVGSVVTEANAVAVEMADEVLVAATPDVVSLRAANRLIRLWDRLHIRKRDDVKVVLNRVSRANEVQPDLAGRVVEAPLARAMIPADFRELEGAVNTGSPGRLAEGGIRKALDRLASEIGLAYPAGVRPLSRARDQSGALSVETVGLFGVILLVALVLWEIVLVGFTFVLAGHAAREGARELAVGGSVPAAVREDLPAGWRRGVRIDQREQSVEVELAVPALVPGVDSPLRLSAEAGTVVEDE